MLSTFFCKSVEPDFKKSGKGDSHVHGTLGARLRHKVFYNWFPKDTVTYNDILVSTALA